jgi:hypothetical protein
VDTVIVDADKLASVYYLYEEISRLKATKRDDYIWLINPESFEDTDIKEIAYPTLFGLWDFN